MGRRWPVFLPLDRKWSVVADAAAQAPLTVQVNSPLEVVHQFFVKLGARYVVVLDADGYCESSFFF